MTTRITAALRRFFGRPSALAEREQKTRADEQWESEGGPAIDSKDAFPRPPA